MSTNHPRDDDRDLAQLAGAFDRPVAPSPSFAARLRTRVQAAVSPRRSMAPPTPIAAHQTGPAPATHVPAARKRRWKGAHLIEVAAAVLLVVAIAFGAFFLNAQRSGEGPDDSRLAALVSPEATVMPVSNATALSRTNGPAWYFPDPAFDATSYSISTIVDDQRYTIRSIQAYGDFLVQTGDFFEGDYGDTRYPMLWVTDASTGEVLWEVREHFVPNFAIANDTIYAVQVSPNGESAITKLVAMSLTTGARVFGETILPVIESGDGVGPVVVGDTVYIADSLGTTFAVDAASGKERWISEGVRGLTPAPSREHPGATGGSLVAEQEAVYVVTGANTIRKLNADDGSVTPGEFDVEYAIDGDVREVTLYRTGQSLIVRAQGAPTSGSDGGAVQMIPETILSLDWDSGTVLWSRPLSEIAGNIVVMNELIIVPVRTAADVPIELQLLNTSEGSWFSGGNVAHISNLSTARTAVISATGAHGTLVMLDSDGLLQIFDLSPQFKVLEAVDVRSVHGEGHLPPAAISNGKAYIANEAGRIYVLTPNE